MDHRQKLAFSFEKQQVARARNQVQDTEYNFAAVPQTRPQDQEGGHPAFDQKWLESSKLGDQGDAGAEKEQQVLARVDTDESLVRQQQMARVRPQAPQFGQQAAKGQKGEVYAIQGPPPAKSKRAAGTEELAFQYQQQLEQTGPESAAAPAPVVGQARGYLGGAPGALAGWVVDLPLRGKVFHFTTPRGEVSVTDRSVSRDLLRGSGRLGITVLAVAAFALAYHLATRLRVPEVISRTGATGLIVLGILSALTGALPVVGVLAVIGGLAARRKLCKTRAVTVG